MKNTDFRLVVEAQLPYGKVVKVNVVNDQEGIDPGTVAVVIE